MTKSGLFGKIIEPDEFRVVSLNNIARIVPPTKDPVRKKLYPMPSDHVQDLKIIKQTIKYYEAFGKHILNVPQDKLALAWSGNIPKIYGPGIHVIHDQNLYKIKQDDFVNADQPVIQHGIYKIIRVYPNKLMKIWINNVPFF